MKRYFLLRVFFLQFATNHHQLRRIEDLFCSQILLVYEMLYYYLFVQHLAVGQVVSSLRLESNDGLIEFANIRLLLG